MRNKYGAKKTTIDGYTFDSRAEANYYMQLKMLLKAGQITDIQLQPRFPLLEPFRKNGKAYRGIDYVADFLVTYPDGRKEVIDVKGKKTETYQVKKKWFESRYPDLTIKEVSA